MNTLLLDVENWDLVIDVDGNIAVASDPYSLAQDTASAIKLFQGELFYDTTKGVPYWTLVLGKSPSLALVKGKLIAAALTVPGVVSAQAFISGFVERILTGQVLIKDTTGLIQPVNF